MLGPKYAHGRKFDYVRGSRQWQHGFSYCIRLVAQKADTVDTARRVLQSRLWQCRSQRAAKTAAASLRTMDLHLVHDNIKP